MTSAVAALPDDLLLAHLIAAHQSSLGLVRRTPVLSSASVSNRCGGTVALKAENLQRTGSFKIRGAVNKLRADDCERGVVAGSAGNHAQAVAYAARAKRVPCVVYMPTGASVSKLAAVEAFGAKVCRHAGSVDDCVVAARHHAADAGMTFVHPFDDLDVIAGQAGVGVELLEDVADLSRVVVPVGGGGLASGVAVAVKQQRPDVTIVGVQAERCAAYAALPNVGAMEARATDTIADGIAIKRPGDLTGPLVAAWLDGIVTVSERQIADAAVFLLERGKLVVEGAGAAGLAGVMAGVVESAVRGTTVVILSGGNIDLALLSELTGRHETLVGRRVRLFARVLDRPGGLAGLLNTVAETGANITEVTHVRDDVALDVRQVGIELSVNSQGRAHTRDIVGALRNASYDVRVLDDGHDGQG